jgi:ABC-2 type transport system permease protein
MKHVWFIMLKDLKLFSKDRMALFFFILFPFVFVIVFNFLLGDVGGGDERIALNVTTLEQQEESISHVVLQAITTEDESDLEPGEPIIVWDEDYHEAREKVENGDISGLLVFPEDFTDEVMQGGGTELTVLAQADAMNTRAALRALASAIASWLDSQVAAGGATVALLVEQGALNPDDAEAIEQVMEELYSAENVTEGQTSIVVNTETVGEVEAESVANQVIPGYLVMFVFFAAALGAEVIVRERENHTLERLLATSVQKRSLLGGIYAGTAAKGLIQIAVFWTVGILAFNIDLGVSPAAVVILSLLVVIMSAAFSIMLAALVKTRRSAGSLAVLSALILAPLGGCWWPLFFLPSWMQFLSKLTPHGWAMSGFNKLMLFGAGFGDVTTEMIVLLGFAALFALIALWRFRTSAA